MSIPWLMLDDDDDSETHVSQWSKID